MTAPYTLVFSDRRTIRVTVERDRQVVVRAPRGTSEEKVRALVEQKKLWVWQKQRDPRKYPQPRPRKEFVSGESFLYRGRHYALEMTAGADDGVRFAGKFLLPRSCRERALELFQTWFMARARELLPPRVADLADRMGVKYRRIGVRDLKYRWGSCTPGDQLVFNWRIIQAPQAVSDYLIVHELAHLLEPNHTARFWNIVAVHAPAHLKSRDWLRQHGNRLEW